MKFIYSLTLAALISSTACSDDNKAGTSDTDLLPPSNVVAERLSQNEVLLTWEDNATNETGYAIMVRRADTQTFNEVAQIAANTTSYTFTSGLEEGYKYYLGVKAYNNKGQSRVISTLFDMQVLADLPSATFQSLNSGENCIWAKYTLANIAGMNVTNYGLCWSADHQPTITDSHLQGPKADANGAVFQVIPDTELDFGTEYKVRAYVETPSGIYYSAPQSLSLIHI